MDYLKATKAILLNTIGIMLLLLVLGCEKNFDDSSRENDEARLEKLRIEINNLSEKVVCEDVTNWKFMPMGAKPCGGPAGYISYSTAIDTNDFIKKVQKYTEESDKFNKKWGIASDCSITQRPIGIICNNGKPQLTYPTNKLLVGTWYLTETLFDPGDGSGRYQPVTGPFKYLNLGADGKVTGGAMPDILSYVVLDENRIQFTKSQDFKIIYRYKQTGSKLEINPPCIEACGYKFSRMQ